MTTNSIRRLSKWFLTAVGVLIISGIVYLAASALPATQTPGAGIQPTSKGSDLPAYPTPDENATPIQAPTAAEAGDNLRAYPYPPPIATPQPRPTKSLAEICGESLSLRLDPGINPTMRADYEREYQECINPPKVTPIPNSEIPTKEPPFDAIEPARIVAAGMIVERSFYYFYDTSILLENMWQGRIAGQLVTIYAGARIIEHFGEKIANPPWQGVLIVNDNVIDLPAKDGTARLVDAEGSRLYLATAGGSSYVFDLGKYDFVPPDRTLPFTRKTGAGEVVESPMLPLGDAFAGILQPYHFLDYWTGTVDGNPILFFVGIPNDDSPDKRESQAFLISAPPGKEPDVDSVKTIQVPYTGFFSNYRIFDADQEKILFSDRNRLYAYDLKTGDLANVTEEYTFSKELIAKYKEIIGSTPTPPFIPTSTPEGAYPAP